MSFRGFIIMLITVIVSVYYLADRLGFDVSNIGVLLTCYLISLGLSFIALVCSSF